MPPTCPQCACCYSVGWAAFILKQDDDRIKSSEQTNRGDEITALLQLGFKIQLLYNNNKFIKYLNYECII